MRAVVISVLAMGLFSGCGSSAGNPLGGDPDGGSGAIQDGGSADAGLVVDGGEADAGAPTDGGTEPVADAGVALAAPTLDTLMKMNGALHIFWTNHQTGCDSIRIERKTDSDPWAEKYSVPGTINNKMDGTATANVLYTYRLRCAKGGAFSEYSNERSRNPRQ